MRSYEIKKTLLIVLVYLVLSSYALLNKTGGGDLLFAGLFGFGLIIHALVVLILLLLQLMARRKSGKPYAVQLLTLVVVAVLFFTFLYIFNHRYN